MSNENKKIKSKWGGKREGSGRKEGSRNVNTIEDNMARDEMRRRVIKSKDALMNSQMNLAKGCQLLFKIMKTGDKPVLVVDQEEIEDYLAGELENTKIYYFITTKVPDNKAIDSLFDRTFGKAPQTVDVTSGGEPIGLEIKNQANKSIQRYLYAGNNKDTSKRQQRNDQGAVPVQSEE